MSTEILNIARKTIIDEADTLAQLANSLDSKFEEVVNEIYHCQGRIVFTGIGKSALIAKKIVATFNSTGTPSIFMHAADAAHGDLGMVTQNDILICLSKSGQTEELKVVIPMVKRKGVQVFGICTSSDCFLAENSDQCIFIPDNGEAEPNNLIPTSSTTAQLALGDAMAICLISLRGFTNSDFAILHPGGSIGKKLYLKVQNMYTKNQKPCVSEEADIRTTILEMTGKRLGATVICQDKQVKGIITDGDLRRMLQQHDDVDHLKAKDIMTENPITIGPEALAYEAFQIIKDRNISHIIVSENNEYLGLIHIHDFIQEGFL